jgi:hypothetical protein
MLAPFTGSDTNPSLSKVFAQYSGGEITFDEAMGMITPMLTEFNSLVAQQMPIWEVLNTAFGQIGTALDINTSAITSNTDAIMGPVNSFLMSLDTGPLAPSQSLANINNIGNSFYTAALADPSQFAAYASFMTSTGIPTQAGLSLEGSSDYESYISGVKGGVMNIPWVQENASSLTVSAGDIGSSVGQNLGPMLLDLKEAIEKAKTVSGTLTIDKDGLAKLVAEELVNNTDFVASVQDM